jgi:hypothetical protein
VRYLKGKYGAPTAFLSMTDSLWHGAPIASLAFDKKRRRLLSAGADGEATIWAPLEYSEDAFEEQEKKRFEAQMRAAADNSPESQKRLKELLAEPFEPYHRAFDSVGHFSNRHAKRANARSCLSANSGGLCARLRFCRSCAQSNALPDTRPTDSPCRHGKL